MTVEMTKAHFDDTLETVLAVAVGGIVFCAMWIIIILVDIEASKVSFFTVDATGKDMDLQLDVTTDDANTTSSGMEVEPVEPQEPEIKATRGRRVSCHFKMMQIGSVLLLILLTYLLLVASNASGFLSTLGALAVFGMFLRFQIGDEIRRQRWDRLVLMVSLFLLIASFLNLSTYAWKSLAQGEIYMGPARIVGYDMSAYSNNSTTNTSVPTTRTNLVVQWGSDWGCPFTGGRVCEAEVHGVMCATQQQQQQNGGGERRRSRRRRMLNNNNQGGGTGNANSNHHPNGGHNGNGGPQHHGNGTHTGWGKNNNTNTNNNNDEEDEKLEKENQDLEKENLELKEEINELEEKNDEEVDEMMDGEEAIEEEMIGDQLVEDVDLIDANEEKEEALADEDEMEEEMDKDEIKDELKDTTDDGVKDELEKDINLLDEEEDETEKDLDAVIDEDEDLADEYQDFADEYFDEADQAIDSEIDEIFDEEDTLEVLDETEEEIDETEEQLDADGLNWDEVTFEYDDDIYENEYWNYDWDSAWGEYGCGDLFDSDIEGQVHDPSIPAGSEDSWPFINIYGSCKHCDAYIMDYFAEEAFVKLDDYFLQAVLFMGLAFTGIGVSLIGFIKYKLAPPAENQIELLGSSAGVIA